MLLIEYKVPNCHNVAGLFTLKPGMNEVHEEDWQEALKLEIFANEYVARGLAVVTGESDKGVTTDGLTVAQAKDLVDKTHDVDLLSKLLDSEKRNTVKSAIEKKLEYLTTPDKPKDAE